MNYKWPLMKETITISDRARMIGFIAKTRKFTTGDKVKEFERKWNTWLGSRYSLFVSSGSTANTLLLAAIKEKYGLKDGDKILVPSCTWATNIGPVIQLGLTPIFADITLDNFSFNLNHLRKIKKQHPDIKVIFVTHLLGFPADNEAYQEIFPKALIIDDVCESHGCLDRYGEKVGANSLGATFSFYFGHHMTTIEGGMVSTNDPELYDLMRMKRSHGMARESSRSKRYAAANPDIDPSFLFVTDGYNFRNHELPAVLGIAQLKRLDSMIEKRRDNYENYCMTLKKNTDKFYYIPYHSGNSSFCFPFIARNHDTAKRLKKAFIENGIEYRPVVSGNLLRHPFLKNYDIAGGCDKTPIVEIVHKNGLYIGNNHFVNKRNMKLLDRIIDEC